MPNVTKTYEIGLYLDKALNDKKMSIKELSKITGINVNLLRLYLVNEKKPSLDVIKKLSSALDKDVEFFINDSYFKNGDIKASILNNNLILHIDETNEKDLRKAYKAMSHMINQIFNSVSLAGKKEILDTIHLYLTTDIYKIAYNEKNPDKNYWKHLYSDNSLLHDAFGIDEKDIAKMVSIFNKLFKPSVPDEKKEELLYSTLDKINSLENVENDKKDDN